MDKGATKLFFKGDELINDETKNENTPKSIREGSESVVLLLSTAY
jgi:hypothetical protein